MLFHLNEEKREPFNMIKRAPIEFIELKAELTVDMLLDLVFKMLMKAPKDLEKLENFFDEELENEIVKERILEQEKMRKKKASEINSGKFIRGKRVR